MEDSSANKIIDSLLASKTEPSEQWQKSVEENLQKLTEFDVTKNIIEGNTQIDSYSNLNFISKIMKNKVLFGGLFTILIVSSLVGVSLFALNYSKREKITQEGVEAFYLSAEQKKEIFENIIKNNSSSILSRQANSKVMNESLSATDNSGFDSINTKIAPPVYDNYSDYNFFHSTGSFEVGPAASECISYSGYVEGNDLITSSTWESYDYNQYNNSGESESYSKYITKNQNGDLIGYSMYIGNYSETASESEWFDYKGGEFAVQTVSKYEYEPVLMEKPMDLNDEVMYKEGAESIESDFDEGVYLETNTDQYVERILPIDDPEFVEPPVEEQDPIEMYFGEGADVINKINENGRDYYIVKTSYEQDCNEMWGGIMYAETSFRNSATDSEESDIRNIVSIMKVDTETFNVVETEAYLESVNQASLIHKSSYTSEGRSVDFNDVKEYFRNDYPDVPVKKFTEVSEPYNPEEEAKKLVQAIKGEDVTILDLESQDANLTGVYSSLVYALSQQNEEMTQYNYSSFRDFYPQGELGDLLYKQATEFLFPYESTDLLNISYQINDIWFDIQVHKNSAKSIKDIIAGQYSWYDVEPKNISLQITIDGKEIEIEGYDYVYEEQYYDGFASDGMQVKDVIEENMKTGESHNRVFWFEYDGFYYIINGLNSYPGMISDFENMDVQFEFSSFSSNNTEKMNKFEEKIMDMYSTNYGY